MLHAELRNGSFTKGHWYVLALPSVAIYIGILLVLIVLHFVNALLVARQKSAKTRADTTIRCDPHRYFVANRLHDIAFARNKSGRIVLLVIFTLSLTSFFFYLIDVTDVRTTLNEKHAKQHDVNWQPGILLNIDLAMNAAFSLHFILRLVAASSKLWFWLSWPTAVDMATIPSCIMYLIYKDHWTGLRFLRAMYILSVPDILQIGGVLRDNRMIQVARIMLQFLTLWLVAAGFVHMFENHGDPWRSDFNGQNLTYLECVYFLIITSSTVGYGDITCKTSLGRLFNVGFVFVGLAMFANVLPQLINIMKIGSPYAGNLRLPDGRRHVLVIGNINTESATKFVEVFLHPDRHAQDLAVVFLHHTDPDLDFEASLKRMENVQYFRGSEMDAADLERVDLVKAEACIILADQFARNPDEEDAANIMRAIAVKNLNGRTRILVQLLLERNKSHLLNAPSWNDLDAVVCLDEFKLGCIAQSCWAPGFSTLLSLLLTVSGADSDGGPDNSWDNVEQVYSRGVGFEMYSADLSPDFAGKSFTKVAELCYQRLELVLLGVKTTEAECTSVTLNPGRNYAIRLGDRGIFVTHSAETANRASYYCDEHHQGVTSPAAVVPCACRTPMSEKQKLKQKLKKRGSDDSHLVDINSNEKEKEKSKEKLSENGQLLPLSRSNDRNLQDSVINIEDESTRESPPVSDNSLQPQMRDGSCVVRSERRIQEKFDFTGMFFWQAKRLVDDAVLTMARASEKNFHQHVVVCVFADPDSPRIGLRNFVMPLRSSNRSSRELKTIVFIGDLSYLRQEWEQIDTFPAIYIMPGSPMDRTILRSVNVNFCDMCVILSAKSMESTKMLMDKHAILCYLNVKSMKFGDFTSDLAAISAGLSLSTHNVSAEAPHDVKTPTDAALKMMSQARKVSNNIPVIVDITIPENILILDDDLTHTSSTPLLSMHPFTCGRTFAGDVLDAVVCAAYFNPDVLALMRELVTGGSTPEGDQIFAEGLGFCEGTDKDLIKRNRNRARIFEFHLADYIPHLGDQWCTYADVFLGALRQFGYVCLAVCRLRNARRNSTDLNMDEQRMVLVSPPETFRLLPNDKIICLQPASV